MPTFELGLFAFAKVLVLARADEEAIEHVRVAMKLEVVFGDEEILFDQVHEILLAGDAARVAIRFEDVVMRALINSMSVVSPTPLWRLIQVDLHR